MGLGLGDFLDLTPFEYLGVKNEFIKHRNRETQEAWERARWTVFKYHCPPEGTKMGNKTFMKLTDFEVFPWEEKANEPPKRDEKRFREAVKRYLK